PVILVPAAAGVQADLVDLTAVGAQDRSLGLDRAIARRKLVLQLFVVLAHAASVVRVYTPDARSIFCNIQLPRPMFQRPARAGLVLPFALTAGAAGRASHRGSGPERPSRRPAAAVAASGIPRALRRVRAAVQPLGRRLHAEHEPAARVPRRADHRLRGVAPPPAGGIISRHPER